MRDWGVEDRTDRKATKQTELQSSEDIGTIFHNLLSGKVHGLTPFAENFGVRIENSVQITIVFDLLADMKIKQVSKCNYNQVAYSK